MKIPFPNHPWRKFKAPKKRYFAGYVLTSSTGRIGIYAGKYLLMREHVLVAEKALGRQLKNGEIVHHINENRSDNRNENLLICDRSYHNVLHHRMNSKRKSRKSKV